MATGLDADQISGAIAYVNLKKPVSSNSEKTALDIRDFARLGRQEKTVKEKLLQAVRFREDPEQFIEFLLSKKPDTDMDYRIRELLI